MQTDVLIALVGEQKRWLLMFKSMTVIFIISYRLSQGGKIVVYQSYENFYWGRSQRISTKRTIESSVPQIYEWTRQGYRSAREWLETRGIEEPDKLPSGSNTEMLSRNVTAVWLMYNAEHINWRNALRNIENPQNPQREVLDFGRFTIPLIASELVRLKY